MMRNMTRLAAALLAAGLWALPATAQSSIDDCEKISAWDAYNRCLASFGPKRGQPTRVTAVPPGMDGPSAGNRRARRGGGFIQRRGGRAFAVFDVSGPARPTPARRRGR